MKEQVAKGKVIYQEGKYFLEVAGKKEEVPVELLTDEEAFKKLVEKEVEVFYSIPRPVVVAFRQLSEPHSVTLCNFYQSELHPGNIIVQPSQEMTRSVAANLLKEGIITKEVHDRIQQIKG